MDFTVGAWNVARGLSDPARHEKIQLGIQKIGTDIVVLSEALNIAGEPVNPNFAVELGYSDAVYVKYDDEEPHTSVEQHICMLSRLDWEPSAIRLATRNAILGRIAIGNGEFVEVIGSHDDDRNPGFRNAIAQAVVQRMVPGQPLVKAGDNNDMHEDDMTARFWRSGPARFGAEHAPFARLHSLGTRLNGMATGSSTNILKQAGMVDADPRHLATMNLKGIPIAQLDRIFVTPDRIQVIDFMRHKLKGSDHWAISAKLQVVGARQPR